MKKIFDLFLAYGMSIGFVSALGKISWPLIYWINGYVLITALVIYLIILTRSLCIFCRKNTRFPNKKNVMSFMLFPLYIVFILYGIIKTGLFLIGLFSLMNGFTYIFINTGLDFMMALSFTVIMSIASGLCCYLYIRCKLTMSQILVSGFITLFLLCRTFYLVQSENNIFMEKNEHQFNGLSLK